MDSTAEGPQRLISPPVEPTAPHSRTLSKTTVTSANLASVGETHLVSSAANFTSGGDKPVPLNASTPRRRPSFMEQQPTPRGSLQWPSTHRSFSSAAATRDSSRHSQATDRLNVSAAATSASGVGVASGGGGGIRGRAPSSTCHTPMSSRDDAQSEHRSSAISGHLGVYPPSAGNNNNSGGGGVGGARRGHSLGPPHTAPPLVDVGGDVESQGPQSASHSVYTTGLCTPRDNTSGTHAGAGGGGLGRHPSPFSAHVVSATVSSPRTIVTPAPPPLDDFEAEAQTLTRAELEERVEQMRGDNVVLRTSVLRLREAVATLKEGLRDNYADIERRQDSIANMLLRRLEATKRHRTKLLAHLRRVELEKASQEMKLHNTKQSIKDLTKHLKREEQEIAERLQGRLEKLHAQREQLDKVLAEQTSSLQQLEQLVQEVEEMGLVDNVEPSSAASQSTAATAQGSMAASATAATAAATHVISPTLLTSADAPMNASANSSAPLSTAAAAAPAPLTSANTVAVPLGQVGAAGLAAPNFHERSSSRVSVTSSTAGTATATTADVAYDPNAMIRYLEEEIAAAEGLRFDALKKADQYVATRERLERRLKREKEHKAEQASRTEALRQELRSASTAVNEKVALQETALEMEVDRHLNSSRLGGDIISSASSTCATPKLRATSAVVSRGNSISPSVGGLGGLHSSTAAASAANHGGVSGEGEAHSAPPPPSDAFLLPSSSFNSAAPAASSLSHGDASVGPHGNTNTATTATNYTTATTATATAVSGCPTGMVVGDLAAPRMSSSSMRINTSMSRDETTASSEGTPHTTRLLVQDTSRMAAPRPVTSAESTPRRTPLATPQLSMSHTPAA